MLTVAATDPNRRDRDNLFERMLQRRPSHEARPEPVRHRSSDASEKEKPEGLERPLSNDVQSPVQDQDQPQSHQTLRRQSRNSRLQRFKDYMRSEPELDDVEDMYAKLM